MNVRLFTDNILVLLHDAVLEGKIAQHEIILWCDNILPTRDLMSRIVDCKPNVIMVGRETLLTPAIMYWAIWERKLDVDIYSNTVLLQVLSSIIWELISEE